jgi:hypothetical protein
VYLVLLAFFALRAGSASALRDCQRSLKINPCLTGEVWG